ncbi:hypothetical protein BS78_07G139300 [Paspalum vaginatum]|nr:hypothetical protein BS78_10G055100 [Paspalum vaginatum]KAJ1268484.1 hypothetical protein BS78_07G139200 [Paspalum vaginatum]KAJ1268485.1 hypothetical protein BS78_07G139300 [Paspalum vaginatum]
MAKGKLMADAFASPREKTITWHEDQTKFMLEWCIEYQKKQHAGFKFRKPHFMLCADALNKKFAMGVTVTQVERHYRFHRENWGFITKALKSSGNTFDHTRCMVKISESEKSTLNDRERRLFAKPIKWYKEMEELYIDSSATGSFARDQNTCLADNDDADNDESEDLIDLNYEAPIDDLGGDDSDTLPSPPMKGLRGNTVSNNNNKRPRGSKSPTKTTFKTKSRLIECSNEVNATMKSLRDTLACIPPPQMSAPQMPALQMPQMADPHASLWQRLEAIPLTPDQRVIIGEHLSAKENERKCGWLSNASDDTLNAWVFKFLCEKEGFTV